MLFYVKPGVLKYDIKMDLMNFDLCQIAIYKDTI